MIFIYYFKNFLPISDIKTILGPLTDKYFHKDADLNLEAIYTTLFSKEDTFVQEVLENVMQQFHMSADLFPDAPKADQASLREFTFICMLSLDIYLKKQLIEAILDKKIKECLCIPLFYNNLFFIQAIQDHIITIVTIIQ